MAVDEAIYLFRMLLADACMACCISCLTMPALFVRNFSSVALILVPPMRPRAQAIMLFTRSSEFSRNALINSDVYTGFKLLPIARAVFIFQRQRSSDDI